VVQIGVGKKNADFNFTMLQRKELEVYGSRNALKQDFLALIDHVSAGDAPLERIITNEYAWTDAPQAFADFDKNAGEMLKVILEW
jgi:threonine dehydrogenase-like Zn-dependent dehydrogenase